MRTLFAGMLLVALIVVFSKSAAPTGGMTFRDLAKLGENFFIAVIGTQLTLVLLAAPAATAGAICLDRSSGMMAHVLVTDLSDPEIVLGKLAARLVPVLGLLACALPLMAILTLLGGVDPDALVGAFVVSVGIAVLGSSLAFLLSLWARKTHEALLGTYAVWGIWLIGRPFVTLANNAYGWTLAVPPRIADPYFLAFSPYWYPGTVSFGDYAWFLAITTGIAAVLVAVAILRLRAVCTRVDVARKRSLRGRLEKIGARIDPTRVLPGPSLDFNPVLWREWHRARPSRLARLVWGLFLVGAATASIAAIVVPRTTFAMAWVNGLQVSIGMLLLSVTAATSLSEERVRGSLDVLMATTLSTREIVLGKWLGTFRLVPSLAVLPVLVIIFSDPAKPHYVPTVLMTLIFVFICGAAITGLGLAMATWCPRLGRAVALTVSAYVLVAVGWMFMGFWYRSGPDGEGFMMASPFFFAGELAADICSPGSGRQHIGWAVFWTVVYGMAALVFLGATLASFNRCLGRVEVGLPPTRRRMRGVAKDRESHGDRRRSLRSSTTPVGRLTHRPYGSTAGAASGASRVEVDQGPSLASCSAIGGAPGVVEDFREVLLAWAAGLSDNPGFDIDGPAPRSPARTSTTSTRGPTAGRPRRVDGRARPTSRDRRRGGLRWDSSTHWVGSCAATPATEAAATSIGGACAIPGGSTTAARPARSSRARRPRPTRRPWRHRPRPARMTGINGGRS